MMKSKIKIQVFIITLFFILFSAFLQITPIATANTIEKQLSINTETFVLLSSLYFLSYAILQIPIGILCDYKGIKYILPISILIVCIGSILFWLASNSWILGTSRLLIGIGCSTAYISAVFFASNYFSKSILPLLIACAEAFGGIGDYLANNFYFDILNTYGWDIANLIIIVFLFILFIYSLFLSGKIIVPDRSHLPKFSFSILGSQLKILFTNKILLGIFAYSFFTWLIIMTFAGFWAKSYYMSVHHFSVRESLFVSEVYWISFLASGLLIGSLVKTLEMTKKTLMVLAIIGLITYILMAIPIRFGDSMTVILTVAAGFSTAGVILAFSLIAYIVKLESHGLAISVNNFFIVLGGLFGQVLFSEIISHFSFHAVYEYCGCSEEYYDPIVMLLISSLLAFCAVFYSLRKLTHHSGH